MSTLLRVARPYLVAVSVAVVLRLVAEMAGLPRSVTTEISVTRLLFILPVFLGLRLKREELSGLRPMVVLNFLYVGWGILLVMAATALDTLLQLGASFAHGPLGGHLLGHAVQIVIMTLVASLICWITLQVQRAQGR